MNSNDTSVEVLLTENLAVDKVLVCFLKNRKVPEGNLYWKKDHKYLSMKIRYMSIPLWIELFRRIETISLQALIRNLPIMEQLLHYSEMEEQQLITFEECLSKCEQIELLVQRGKTNPKCKHFIEKTIREYPEYESLRRGNFLLYYFLLYFDDQRQKDLCKTIYLFLDFIICGCIVDDLVDAQEDASSDELNILNELGGTMASLAKVKVLYSASLDRIKPYYPELEAYCEDIFSKSAMIYLDKLKIW